jgi:hypothetical protein
MCTGLAQSINETTLTTTEWNKNSSTANGTHLLSVLSAQLLDRVLGGGLAVLKPPGGLLDRLLAVQLLLLEPQRRGLHNTTYSN